MIKQLRETEGLIALLEDSDTPSLANGYRLHDLEARKQRLLKEAWDRWHNSAVDRLVKEVLWHW